jgi:hypothetical protein
MHQKFLELDKHPLWKGSEITHTDDHIIFTHPGGAVAKIYKNTLSDGG